MSVVFTGSLQLLLLFPQLLHQLSIELIGLMKFLLIIRNMLTLGLLDKLRLGLELLSLGFELL